MRHYPLAWLTALVLGVACGDSTATTANSTAGPTTTNATPADTDTCTVGSEGCACTPGGGCDPGLTCLSELCVDADGTSGDPPTTTDGSASNSQGTSGDPDTTTPVTSSSPATSSAPETSAGSDDTGAPKLDVGVDTTTGAPAEGCRKIDVLFVLDGSGSMAQERNALAAVDAFGDIVDTLSGLGDGDIDYRIAVTTDNDDGYITPGCWQEPDDWVASVGHTPAEVADAFNCAVSSFGTNTFEAAIGCEHALTSAVDLLDGDDSGFVRDDALLVLVLVTDVDDYGAYDQQGGNQCGLGCATKPTDLAVLHQKLLAVKDGEPDGLAAVVVAGDPGVNGGMNFCGQPGSCGCDQLDCAAFHADRLYQFTDLLGQNGVAADICGGANAVPSAVDEALNTKIDLACMVFEPPQ
jgi:hypothetical protein